MSGGLLDLLWLVFMLIVASWGLSVLIVTPLTHVVVSRVGDPARRGGRALWTASIPWLVPLTVGAAVLATAGSKALGWIADHCPHHGLGHPHLCFSHLPTVDLGSMHGALAGAVVAPVALSLARLLRAEYHATRELSILKGLAVGHGRLRVVPASVPIALAGGLFEPLVLLSRGLLQRLPAGERRIVLAHEAAHLRHGDARRNFCFELLLLLHLPTARRALRLAWLRALEERADDAVARRFGAERVVETLLHVARLRLQPSVSGFSVAGMDLTHRVRRLLDGDRCHGAGVSFEVGYALVLSAVFAAAVLDHHALETLLGLIAGH